MKKISLENVPRDVSFTRIYGLDQNWNTKSNRSWSCVGAPRDQNGFMYILCEEVYITTKEGRRLLFAKGDLLYISKGSEYNITFSTALGEFTNILINFNIRDTNGEEYALADDIVCFANDIPAKIVDDMFTVANLSTRLAYPTIPVTKTFYEILEKLNKSSSCVKAAQQQPELGASLQFLPRQPRS